MIQVVENALDLLELFAQNPERTLTLQEVAEHLGIRKTACANLLKTMVDKNFIDRQSKRSGYTCGPMLHLIGRRTVYQRELVSVCEPYLEELAKKTGVSWTIAIMRNGRRFNLLDATVRADGLRLTQQIRDDGKHPYSMATGRLLLAYLPDEELSSMLERRGEPTPENWPEAAAAGLKAELEKIRREGAVLKSPAGGAAPLWQESKVAGTLAFWIPEGCFDPKRWELAASEMLSCAAKISQRLSS